MSLPYYFFVYGIRVEYNIRVDASECYLDGNGWYLYTDIEDRELLAQVLNRSLETMIEHNAGPVHTYKVLTNVYEGWVGEPMAGKECRADDLHKESNTHRKLIELLCSIYGPELVHGLNTLTYKVSANLP